jgi:hypothetical protein
MRLNGDLTVFVDLTIAEPELAITGHATRLTHITGLR